MSLKDAFYGVEQGKYGYYSIEEAINSYRKEKRLNIIEENLTYLCFMALSLKIFWKVIQGSPAEYRL